MRNRIRMFTRALRLHQQVKNLLVFVPLFTSHQLADTSVVFRTCVAFCVFCFAASSGYLLNDFLDRENDRLHPLRGLRPLASGEMTAHSGLLLSASLGLAALAISCLLPAPFFITLLTYVVLTTSYSLWFKRIAVMDVLLLAGMYTLRIIGGLTATALPYSFWLLAFSVFMFLSLAFAKRCAELIDMKNSTCGSTLSARGYRIQDMEIILILGGVSGYLAVLIMALYVNSSDVVKLYRYPQTLWLLCPVMLFWVSRIWLITNRGEMHYDPIEFALKDRASIITLAASIAIIMGAM